MKESEIPQQRIIWLATLRLPLQLSTDCSCSVLPTLYILQNHATSYPATYTWIPSPGGISLSWPSCITEHGYRILLYHFLYLDDLQYCTILSCSPVIWTSHAHDTAVSITNYPEMDRRIARALCSSNGRTVRFCCGHTMGQGPDHACMLHVAIYPV